MATVTKIRRKEEFSQSVVYDISMGEGTFVDALTGCVLHNTDGFNFQLPKKYRYTKEHPYIGKGNNREVKKGEEYNGYEADVAEFNDLFMGKAYGQNAINKMGLGIDEVLTSSINVSRKNYLDYFPENPFPKDVKKVGNTLKSKKLQNYVSSFMDIAVRQLLRGDGQAFIEEYYSMIDKIYNYRIPLRDIASKGKIKKSIEEYKRDVKQLTKAGRPKSRQAWYELVIKENLLVGNGDTVYYVNTGTSKSHTDVKKLTKYYVPEGIGGKTDVTKTIEKRYKEFNKSQKDKPKDERKTKEEWLSDEFPDVYTEEEVKLACRSVPREIIESDEELLCSDVGEDFEYNCPKYISIFNNRIRPLLVCFSKEIRDDIIVDNPKDRKYFTKEQCRMVSGEPNKPSDQDTYEQLMTMEDKEIRFWTKYGLTPPFLEECGMGKWEDIVKDYEERMEYEKKIGIDKEKEQLEKVINDLSMDDIETFLEEGTVPSSVLKVADLNPETFDLMSKNYKDIKIGCLNDILEAMDRMDNNEDNDDEE